MAKIVNGYSLPNIPGQPRPENDNSPIWRYDQNPIIGRHDIPRANSIFNSAVVPYKGEFAGVFRCDDRTGHMDLYVGHSKDGVKWEISNDPIVMYNEQGEVVPYEYRYDPRVLFMDDKWYVTWCNGFHGPTIVSHLRLFCRIKIYISSYAAKGISETNKKKPNSAAAYVKISQLK